MTKSKKKRKTRCFYYSYCFGRFGKIFLQWRADSDLEHGKALFELKQFPGEWIFTWKALRVFVAPWSRRRGGDEPLWGIN